VSSDAGEWSFPLDSAGFLDAEAAGIAMQTAVVPGSIVDPIAVWALGPLVLLGEPGIGKTTTFRQLAQTTTDADPAAVVYLDGAHLDSTTLKEALDPILKGTASVLILDQVDESPILRRLPELLEDVFKTVEYRPRVLLACRTAEYPERLTKILTALFGPVAVAELAPLTRTQAEDLSDSADCDGARLVRSAVAVSAGALASTPLTLELLVRRYKAKGDLDARPAELFADGVRLLAAEWSDRRRPEADETASAPQVLAVAARIASRLLLSGRRSIWVGRELEGGLLDLPKSTLAGGQEMVDDGNFDVTPLLINEAMRRSLFTGNGEQRLSFRHSSIAAYLAAWYLIEKRVDTAQLKALFLVAAPHDEASIPETLRETAAWLVALDPAAHGWLVSADPEGLASHSAFIDSDDVRRLLVAAILANAERIILGDRPWSRTRWRLSHPGLADQLGEVFLAYAGERDWPSLARLQVALHLAANSDPVQHLDTLLAVLQTDSYPPHLREQAAKLCFEAAPHQSVSIFKSELDRLTDPQYAGIADPDDDLRGELLNTLWPEHLEVEDCLINMHSPQRTNYIGSYWSFLHNFPASLRDDDIKTVANWVLTNTANAPRLNGRLVDGPSLLDNGSFFDGDPTGIRRDFISSLIARAFDSENIEGLLTTVARLLLDQFARFERTSMPPVLDQVDDAGVEIPSARLNRRHLADALITASFDQPASEQPEAWLPHQIVDAWEPADRTWRPDWAGVGILGGRTRLIDAHDFTWAIRQSQKYYDLAQPVMGNCYARLAALLLDPLDRESVEIAYELRGTNEGEYVKRWFDAVPLDEAAALMAKRLSASRSRVWDGFQNWSESIRDLLNEAEQSNTDAFWKLCYKLLVSPDSGYVMPSLKDDLWALPGLAVFNDDNDRQRLKAASETFLRLESDHYVEWLGTDQWDKRAWAGYLALASYERQDATSQFANDLWAKWAGATLWFPSVVYDTGDRQVKQALLARTAAGAPAELARAVDLYARNSLDRAQTPHELMAIDPSICSEVAEKLLELIVDVKDGRWGTDNSLRAEESASPPKVARALAGELLERLLSAGTSGAVSLASEALNQLGIVEPPEFGLTVALALLRSNSRANWSAVYSSLDRVSAGARREFVYALIEGGALSDLTASLDEYQLAQLFDMLVSIFPSEDDNSSLEAHWMTLEEQARRWRDDVLRQLSNRQSVTAIEVLTKIAETRPADLAVGAAIVAARTGFLATAWVPPAPGEVAHLLRDSRRRIVRDNAELCELLLETIQAIEDELSPHSELLWDRVEIIDASIRGSNSAGAHKPKRSKKVHGWQPKPEAALSAYLAHELKLRLTDRGLAVNREVLIIPRDAYGAGDRPDILVQAHPRPHSLTGDFESHSAVSQVPIEIKGIWNPELLDAQRSQLADRYIKELMATHGIYLVGSYSTVLWDVPVKQDRRKTQARKLEKDLKVTLATQAEELATEGLVTKPYILAIPRPQRAAK
jgi:hypothetical protein